MEKPTILYIDDETNNLLVFEANIRRSYKVLITTSATEAMQWLETQTVEAVIADQVMPTILGTEFLAEVQRKYPHIPRILLTGYNSHVIDKDLVQYLLTKPWDKQTMLGLLEKVMAQKET